MDPPQERSSSGHAPDRHPQIRCRSREPAPAKAGVARRQVRRQGCKSGYTPSRETLNAASWLIIVTSLRDDTFTTDDVLALYRLRWRIELGLKRLKSLVGLKKPPGIDDRSAKPRVLAHLLMILLLEPAVDALEDSPRSAFAA
jgi:hypothetical protein